jgi:hypothetical protein
MTSQVEAHIENITPYDFSRGRNLHTSSLEIHLPKAAHCSRVSKAKSLTMATF